MLLALRFTPGPVALALVLCAAAAPVLGAFLVVSCVTGRAAAALTNLIQVCLAEAGLKKLAHASRRAAVRTRGANELP